MMPLLSPETYQMALDRHKLSKDDAAKLQKIKQMEF